jgi:hypothetical protein
MVVVWVVVVAVQSKLATLDRARQGKEEELRSLERKLVVLLDEQQRELESIKRRQVTSPTSSTIVLI